MGWFIGKERNGGEWTVGEQGQLAGRALVTSHRGDGRTRVRARQKAERPTVRTNAGNGGIDGGGSRTSRRRRTTAQPTSRTIAVTPRRDGQARSREGGRPGNNRHGSQNDSTTPIGDRTGTPGTRRGDSQKTANTTRRRRWSDSDWRAARRQRRRLAGRSDCNDSSAAIGISENTISENRWTASSLADILQISTSDTEMCLFGSTITSMMSSVCELTRTAAAKSARMFDVIVAEVSFYPPWEVEWILGLCRTSPRDPPTLQNI